MSRNDRKRGVRIPLELTAELAEFIGIMIGDGHLGYYKGVNYKGKKYVCYQIKIACNKKEERFISYIRQIFFLLFGVSLSYIQDGAPGSILLSKNSKGIVNFLNKTCEIPLNSKTSIVRIPQIIKDASEGLRCTFLRGLADTDFSVSFKNRTGKGRNYPVIKGSFKSQFLIQDLTILFKDLGFTFCTLYNEKRYDRRSNSYTSINNIYLNGKRNFGRWANIIGF